MDRHKIAKITLGICLALLLSTPLIAQKRVNLMEVPFPEIRQFQGSSSYNGRSLDGLMRRWWLYRGKTESYKGAPSLYVFGKREKITIPWHWQGFSVESTFSRAKTEHWDGLLEVIYEDKFVQIKEEYNPEKIIVVNGKVVFSGMERLTFTIKKKSKIEEQPEVIR